MSTHPVSTSSRRSVLTAALAGVAAGGATFGVQAATAEPDPIFALIEAVRETKVVVDGADDELEAAHDRHREMGGLPAIPADLIRDPKRDWLAGFYGFIGSQLGDGRWWYGAPDDIAYLREPRLKQDWTRADLTVDGAICDYVPDPRGQARADEILVAWDAYQAEIERRIQVSGLAEARRLSASADRAYDDARMALAMTRATTPAGIRAKARYAFEGYEEDVYLTEAIQESSVHDALNLSILRDLVAMEPRA